MAFPRQQQVLRNLDTDSFLPHNFCHTKSVEKKEREETKGERKEKGDQEKRKEGEREEACVGSMVRMP